MFRLRSDRFARVGLSCLAIVLSVCLVASLLGCVGGENKVRIGRAQWNYDIINATVLSEALEDHGYQVEIKDIFDMGLMFAAVNEGSIDIYQDAWLPDTHASYVETAEHIVTGGNLWGGECPYVWTVPTFVVEEHGIASIDDLKGNADIFDGKITGIEEGTGGTNMSRDALEQYQLEQYEYVASSVPAMIAEVKAAAELHEPVVAIMWRPHPIFDQIDLTMLEDPLGVFASDTIQYAVYDAFAEANPDIMAFLDSFLIPMADIESMMAENENNNVPAEDLGVQWYQDHKSEVESWWP